MLLSWKQFCQAVEIKTLEEILYSPISLYCALLTIPKILLNSPPFIDSLTRENVYMRMRQLYISPRMH